MAVWGLDVQQVRQLSTQLNQKAGEIEGALTTLTSKLAETQWEGPDATSFRSDWAALRSRDAVSLSRGACRLDQSLLK